MGLNYAVVGCFASIAFGAPRYTNDINILVDLPVEHVCELYVAFPAPAWRVSAAAASAAVAACGQFNVIHTSSGNNIDFFVAGDDLWHRSQRGRRNRVAILGDTPGYSAHPEDVILGNLRYYEEGGSDKHRRGIAGILAIRSRLIDHIGVGTGRFSSIEATFWTHC